MSIFESIIYGLISGFSEFLPVSSQGHQAILLHLFGMDTRDPLRDMIIHISVLAALLTACKSLFLRMRREQMITARSRKKRNTERRSVFDLRLVKTTTIPLIAGLLFYITTRKFETELLYLVLFFLLNGLLLIVPEYIRQGNKDARFMTGLDGIMLGVFGALSAFPGISRVGAMNAYSIGRGANRQHALNWILMLSIPAILLFLGIDIYSLFVFGFDTFTFSVLAGYILSGLGAFFGGYFGVVLVRFLTVRTGFTGFAYYSWGTAIFSFVLYLIA